MPLDESHRLKNQEKRGGRLERHASRQRVPGRKRRSLVSAHRQIQGFDLFHPCKIRALAPRGGGCFSGHLYRTLGALADRKSTRLNSSHQIISYAVFCLKKKKKKYN